jgi:adenylate kinase
MGRVLILLGPPGAGKGTQAARLGESLGLTHVSTGDLFRTHLEHDTPVGQRARAYMDKGELVPDEVVLEMLTHRLAERDCSEGCLLDGFPRTRPQAEALEQVVLERGWTLQAISLEVPNRVLVERLSGRRMCRRNGEHIHHVRFGPVPRVEQRCNECGGELYQREDDSAEVVLHRLEVYHRSTEPLMDFYRDRGVLSVVDGDRAPEVVLAEIERLAQEAA